MTEKEIDAERMQGNILEIKELGQFAMPRMKTEYGNGRGVEITIQNIQCTVPAKGTLKVGDYVEVEYLPKSGYILYINEMANKKIAYNNKDNKELLITNTYSSYEIDKLRRNVEGEVLSEPIVESIEYYSLSESSMETDKYSYVPYILELDRTNK